ncbi:MAG: ribonuclease III [Cytophagaceae bacterium]|nr:ribonuclease III [Cytophagaceae bacterium]
MFGPIVRLFKPGSDKDKSLKKAVSVLIGARPGNLMVYRLAFMHTSAGKELIGRSFRESNERLEYLGDAVLGMVVAEYLFKKFPYKDEGFLTEIRSRIVNRESLNIVARKLGLDRLVEFDANRRTVLGRTSMYGDALEAFVGAVYLDKGFQFTRKFILKRLISGHFDLDEVVQTNANFKSIIIEWAQREGRDLRFDLSEHGNTHNKEFTANLVVDNQSFAVGTGYSKKKAEQSAAEKACEKLELKG